jgi:hypothetical protein
VQDNGKTFDRSLQAWGTKIDEKIGMVKTAVDRSQLAEEICGEIRAQVRKVAPGETDYVRGIWLTQIQKTQPQLTHLIRNEIGHFWSELLTPAHPDFSLNSASSWIEAILTYINEYQHKLEDYIQSNSNLSSQEELDLHWRNIERRLQAIEERKGFLGLLDNHKQKNRDFQIEATQLVTTTKKLIQDNFNYQIQKTALVIANDISTFIRSLKLEIDWLNQLLISVELNYQRGGKDLARLNPDGITGEALFAPEDSDTCYLEFLPEQNKDSILIDISGQILKDKFRFIDRSLIHFLIEVNDGSINHPLVCPHNLNEKLIETNITETIDKLFGTQSISSLQPVMARFLQKYSLASGNAERRMRQIISESQPLLPLLTRDGHFYEDGGNKSEIIAFERTDDRASQQLQELLTRNVGISESTIKSIQNNSEIVIVNEYAAFPLRLIQGIDRMREHYDREYSQNRARIHNDYQQIFSEIIPPYARRMEEMQDAFYACLAFGILVPQDNCYLYEVYDDFRDRYNSIQLSLIWSEALEQISKANGVADSLKQRRNSIVTEIQTNPSQWTEVYLPQLRTFIQQVDSLSKYDPNYPEIGIVLGEEGSIDRIATNGVLKRLWGYLDRLAQNPITHSKSLQAQPSVNHDRDSIDVDILDAGAKA